MIAVLVLAVLGASPTVVVRGIDYTVTPSAVYARCEWSADCGPYRLTWRAAVRSMVDPSMGDDERLGA